MSLSSTMMDFPLTIGHILRHGSTVHRSSMVSTWSPDGVVRASFEQVAERAGQLARLLTRLGIRREDVVGTLAWNHQQHLEAYLAVPAMGAVLLTLNLRMGSDQLIHVINHGGARVIIVDAALLSLLQPIMDRLPGVEHIIAIDGDAGADLTGASYIASYDAAIAQENPGFDWPDLDERSAAGMCYTSGTTGDAKGVVYSHRSQVLHAFSINSAANMALTERDRILVIVPLFHANAWGTPYAGWWAGADFLLPRQFVQSPQLASMIAAERPTFSAAVPTIWADLLAYAGDHDVDLSSFREVISGGSAVPRALIERYKTEFDLSITQGWGMTECSPLAALARPPAGCDAQADLDYRVRSGRIIPGMEVRLVDDGGSILPWDGTSLGEIQIRGAWVTGSYLGDTDPSRFKDGWLWTGDVGIITPDGYIQLMDRAKDVIKSGGEWISSVAMENRLMAHADVLEAAVVGIEDDRWGERPLPCVVMKPGCTSDCDALRGWLAAELPNWWLPSRWWFIDEIPRTSVGKFDKKALRAAIADGACPVVPPTKGSVG